MNLAPVIIPTLNRYDHLKACLESLEKCTWAEDTEVFVALDYPLNENHWEGYRKILGFLNDFQSSCKFKKFHIIKRPYNFGIGVNGNLETLQEEIMQKYDSVIVSEDDNIFSPAFLVFINKALERYEKDKSIIAICGYKHYYKIKKSDNNIYRQNIDFSAWGYGIWRDRYQELKGIDYKWYRKKMSLKNLFKLYKDNGGNRALEFIDFTLFKSQKYLISDNSISVVMGLTNRDVIMPTQTCVINKGIDGSGEHFKNKAHQDLLSNHQEKLYSKPTYEIKGDPSLHYEFNNRSHKNNSYERLSLIKFLYLSFRMTSKFILTGLMTNLKGK